MQSPEICGKDTNLSGTWVDGTQLVDDSLSWDSHVMGSFLTSEVNTVRMAENPRSETPYDRLEFTCIVRGWQSEEDRNGSPNYFGAVSISGNVGTRT